MNSLARRLPPLQALVVFESAARCGSFTRAALELCVTQGAVSRRIRELEESLGRALFVRTSRGVRTTPEGEALLRVVRDGLGAIADCVETVFADADPNDTLVTIRLGLPPSLASHWLIGRLTHFRTAHPGYQLEPVASIQLHDLRAGGVDATIRYGLGHYADVSSVELAPERLVAVCAPALWSSEWGVDALANFTFLEAYASGSPRPVPPVQDWARHNLLPLPPTITRFNRQSLAMLAAIDGQGVAVVPWQLARDQLARRALVQPVQHHAPDACAYHLVWDPEHAPEPLIERLRAWLVGRLAP